MNKLLLNIIFLLLSCSIVAQEVEILENPITFHVRIGAWINVPDSIQTLVVDNKYLVVEGTTCDEEPSMVYKIHTAKGYKCFTEASKQAKYYIGKGYKGAFVIAFDRRKRISKMEAIEKTKSICK